MPKKSILVVGSGFAGSTCARKFADAGFSVDVFEKLSHVAGHCHDMRNEHGITVHTYGPHIFHTTNKKVWDYVNQFSDFHPYQHRVLSYAQGNLYPFPINRDTLCKVFGVDLSILEVKGFLEELKNKNDSPKNYEEAVLAQVGPTLYSLFFENYTRKQWGRDPRELSAEMAKRIPVRENRDDRYFSDQYQGIPEAGYTELISSMLDSPNIQVYLNHDYFEAKLNKTYDLIVYTGPIDRFFDYSEGTLAYRSLKLVLKNYETEFYQPVATVNYPNDYDWTRITEYKHFLSEKSSWTTVCFEYPSEHGEPYYIVPDKTNSSIRARYMRQVDNLERQGTHLFVGRLAEYTYYNMDQVIKQAMEKADYWIKVFA